MVYQTKVRMQQDATFGAFDCPDAGQIAAEPTASTTPLAGAEPAQQPVRAQQADVLRRAAPARGGGRRGGQVRRGFRLAFGREPDDEETRRCDELVRRARPAAFCRALFNANEFLFVH